MRDEQRRKVAVEKGLPSLLRRERSRQGRRRYAPLFWCAVAAAGFVPAGAFSAPSPDPPPPGAFESPRTSLAPDTRPRRTGVATTPPAPVEQVPPTPAQQMPSSRVEQVKPPRVTPRPAANRPSTPRPDSSGRRFVPSEKATRWLPPADPIRPDRAVALPSSTPDRRPYLLAAFSLGVFVLGTGTLLTVLARLGSIHRGLA